MIRHSSEPLLLVRRLATVLYGFTQAIAIPSASEVVAESLELHFHFHRMSCTACSFLVGATKSCLLEEARC